MTIDFVLYARVLSRVGSTPWKYLVMIQSLLQDFAYMTRADNLGDILVAGRGRLWMHQLHAFGGTY